MKNKYTGLSILIILVLIFIGLALTSIRGKSGTMDELSHHIPSGYVFLTKGDFVFATDSPPLARYLVAAPLLAMDVKLPDDRSFWAKDDRSEFAREFIFDLNRKIAGSMLFYARLPMILLGAIGGIFMFFWVRRHYDQVTAVIAAIFYFLSPNILAHARLATTDIAATVLIMCAVFSFWDFISRYDKKSAVITGLFIGLAAMAKYSALLMLPVFSLIVAGTIFRDAFRTRQFSGKKLLMFCLCLGISVIVLWAGYLFEFKPFLENVLRPEAKAEFLSGRLQGIFPGGSVKIKEILYTVPVPLGSYALGVLGVLKHGAEGARTFFMGKTLYSGHPLYYIVAFFVKTPIPVIVLFFTGIGLSCRDQGKRSLNLYFVSMITIFMVMASRANLQLGLRYVLPVYPFIFVVAAYAAARFSAKGSYFRAICIAIGVWYLIIQALIWPDYLSYFNEAIGGPGNGYKYLKGSNLDWGQDLPALKKYMDINGINEVVLSYSGSSDPLYHGIKHKNAVPEELVIPDKRVYAISVNDLDTFEWTRDQAPSARAGYSIHIYDFREKQPE